MVLSFFPFVLCFLLFSPSTIRSQQGLHVQYQKIEKLTVGIAFVSRIVGLQVTHMIFLCCLSSAKFSFLFNGGVSSEELRRIGLSFIRRCKIPFSSLCVVCGKDGEIFKEDKVTENKIFTVAARGKSETVNLEDICKFK